MRSILSLLLITLLLLAACTGGDATTAPADNNQTQNQTTGTAGDGTPTQDPNIVIVTRGPTPDGDALEVPLPGTLVASETEDPNAALIFTRIKVTQYGGPPGTERREVELFGDGTLVVNKTPAGSVGLDKVNEIDTILDELNFYGLQGTMMGPIPESGNIRYSITVVRGEDERTIMMEDTFYPREMDRILVPMFDLATGQ